LLVGTVWSDCVAVGAPESEEVEAPVERGDGLSVDSSASVLGFVGARVSATSA
jgi:hypothetical protein